MRAIFSQEQFLSVLFEYPPNKIAGSILLHEESAVVQYHLLFYHSTGVILLALLLSSSSDGPCLFELFSLVLV